MAITTADMIASVKREIAFRERCYPRWVQDKKMSQAKSDHEIACMKEILDLLTEIELNGAIDGLRQL